MLVDSHCHLEYDDYKDEGLEVVLQRAKSRDVSKFLTISTQLAKFQNILKVAESYEDVYCSAGTHPHHAEEVEEIAFTKDKLVKLFDNQKVVAVGEAGLDYYYEHSSKEMQKICFEKHIEASIEAGLPLVVHTRDAEQDTIDILKSYAGKARGVMHCFSGSMELAKASLDLGFYISFSGIITFKKSDAICEVAKYVPLERCLVETDCPYLAPIPYRGKRNEPAFVYNTAIRLSELKKITIDEVSENTTENFFNLFDRVKR